MVDENSEIDSDDEQSENTTDPIASHGKGRKIKLVIFLIILIIIIGIVAHLILVYLAAKSVEITEQKVDNITAKSALEYEVTFTLTLNNPSSTEIEIEKLTYQAYLEGDYIGEGEKSEFTIEPGETEHTFKFSFNINDLTGSVRILFLQESATLKIIGDATIPVKLFGQLKVSSITVSYEYYKDISS